MRFDEVSARYAEFGPFFVGLVMEPRAALERADARPARTHRSAGGAPGAGGLGQGPEARPAGPQEAPLYALTARDPADRTRAASATGQWRSTASASSA